MLEHQQKSYDQVQKCRLAGVSKRLQLHNHNYHKTKMTPYHRHLRFLRWRQNEYDYQSKQRTLAHCNIEKWWEDVQCDMWSKRSELNVQATMERQYHKNHKEADKIESELEEFRDEMDYQKLQHKLSLAKTAFKRQHETDKHIRFMNQQIDHLDTLEVQKKWWDW
jgi:hypothetical protein